MAADPKDAGLISALKIVAQKIARLLSVLDDRQARRAGVSILKGALSELDDELEKEEKYG